MEFRDEQRQHAVVFHRSAKAEHAPHAGRGPLLNEQVRNGRPIRTHVDITAWVRSSDRYAERSTNQLALAETFWRSHCEPRTTGAMRSPM